METLTVHLPEKLKQFVEERAAACHKSADDYVCALLEKDRQIKEEQAQKYAVLKKDIAVAIEQSERGESKLYTSETLDEFFEEIKFEGRRRLAEIKSKKT